MKSSNPSAQVCWKTSDSTPKQAATEARFSSVVTTAIARLRNVNAIITSVSPSTNAITYGSLSR